MSALRKVLVVDDDAVVGKSFNRVLSQKGYLVTTAQNAHEALKQVREQSFDVVFTDIKMPGICLLYTSPSPRDRTRSRMPSSA